MQIKEYLALFSNNGTIEVRVEFTNFAGKVSSQRMNPSEIVEIISSEQNAFDSKMTFDEFPFVVHKYEVDPINNILTINAKPQ